MKARRIGFANLLMGSLRGWIGVATVAGSFFCIPTFAQEADEETRAEAIAGTEMSVVASTADEVSTGQTGAAVFRVDMSEFIAVPPPAAGQTFSRPVPPIVAAYLPVTDTNIGIGISYPAGSPDFAYLVAGMPRRGDPRLPVPAAAIKAVPMPASPQVMFEPAESGSGAVMTRVTEAGLIRSFPPGTAIRRVAEGKEGGGLVPYRHPERTETGEELVWNFPPGAKIANIAVAKAE